VGVSSHGFQPFSVDHFISQFPRLATTFKCYKVYWPNDQERIFHETKSLTMVASQSFQDIGNELDRFHPHETDFISFIINTVPRHLQIDLM
jgi:D-serine dehydratase